MGSLGETKSAVDHALTLAPDELSVRLALGYYYYYGLSDFERALEVFQAVVRDRPNDADALEARAWIERRLGRWNDFFATFDRVLELDPARRR